MGVSINISANNGSKKLCMAYFHYFHLFHRSTEESLPFSTSLLQWRPSKVPPIRYVHSLSPKPSVGCFLRQLHSFSLKSLKSPFYWFPSFFFTKTLNMPFPSVVRSFSLALLRSPSFLLVHFSFTEALKGSLYITFYTFFPPKSLVSPYIHYLHSSSLSPFLSTGPQDKQSVHHLQYSSKTESLNRTLHFTIPIFITEALCWPHFFITHSLVHRNP